jgi:preprotein translocase subunit SecG
MDAVKNVLLVAYLLIVLAMIAVILLQRSEGGGLGIGGNSGGLMTVRGQANLLTRTTAILATLFFGLAIGLALLGFLDRGNDVLANGPASSLGGASASASAAPPGAFDALSELEQEQGATSSAAPVAGQASNAGTLVQSAPADDTASGLALPLSPAAIPALPSDATVSAPAAAASAPATDASAAASAPAAPAAASAPPASSEAPAVTSSAPPSTAASTDASASAAPPTSSAASQ